MRSMFSRRIPSLQRPRALRNPLPYCFGVPKNFILPTPNPSFTHPYVMTTPLFSYRLAIQQPGTAFPLSLYHLSGHAKSLRFKLSKKIKLPIVELKTEQSEKEKRQKQKVKAFTFAATVLAIGAGFFIKKQLLDSEENGVSPKALEDTPMGKKPFHAMFASPLLATESYKCITMVVKNGGFLTKNFDTGVIFPAYYTVLTIQSDKSELKSIALNQLDHKSKKKFSSVDTSYRFEIFLSEEKQRLMLPFDISTNLIKFLQLYRQEDNDAYCCVSFAYELSFGRGVIKNHNVDKDTFFHEFKEEIFDEKKLKSGDIVVLKNKKNINTHYALYLGYGKYLSLFGRTISEISGPLIVTDADAMLKGFDAKSLVRVAKR